MPNATADTARTATRNLILDYYDRLPAVIDRYVPDPGPVEQAGAFTPGFALPELDDGVREYFSVAGADLHHLGEYGDSRLMLLDLMRNPGTNTTKTLASLLIVARAVEYIRRTGNSVLIFSPTSANKGTALRDAVWRAISTGLAGREQLRIVTLAPKSCVDKLRSSPLSAEDDLRELNPVLVYDGAQPEDVKLLGKRFVEQHGAWLAERHGSRMWFSLELRNYVIADAARAFLEQDITPARAGQGRVHAHAVSSAFGLLGYSLGREVLEEQGIARAEDRAGYLLVQHLGTPDMVLSLHYGSHDRSAMPEYTVDTETGLYVQHASPHFPQVTFDPEEVLDPTFYTRAPVTSAEMNPLIETYGGAGIVVSLAECLRRYPVLRPWYAGTSRPLPGDFRTVREWSLVMATTGVLNALDRGLIKSGGEVVVHGSGFYTTADYMPLEREAMTVVRTVDDIVAALT
ncbi:DUF6002 family protein [Amycolatopsis taiwanensis]|uniref:DUF6002 family protein n=1 Tax=Amycolatopsis taiwanensis TaxID=342230 RepID=UPI0004806EFF|nr:DUF6002 family protein [Amycolatopsis taiwanensis]